MKIRNRSRGHQKRKRRDRGARTGPKVNAREPRKRISAKDTATLQKILNLLPAPIFVYQGDKNILINPAAEGLTGYTKKELLDMKYWEIVHPEFRELIKTRGSARQHGDSVPPRYEVKILTKSGEERWLDFIGGLIRIDGKPAVIGTVMDLTERKQAQERLQLESQRLNALRKISLAITSTLDLKGVLEVLLREIDHLLPYAATTVRLKNRASDKLENVACCNINEREWKAGAAQTVGPFSERVLKTKTPIAVRNLNAGLAGRVSVFFRKQGFLSYLGVPLIAKGEVLGILSFYTREEHDFTQEEIEFVTTLAGQAAVAIHNSQLYEASRKQAAELEEINKLKDEFLGFVSHELRTPLNAVIGYTGMMQDELFGAINTDQRRALGKTLVHARHLLHMINSLLEATKIEVGAAKLESREVSLRRLLDELKWSYDTPLDKELTLGWEYPDTLPAIVTDREKLKHILQNLVDNAIKFTERGTITISARALPGNKSVEFKVTDTGVGISPGTLPDIFDMFRQGINPESSSSAGVGLGLHIVKKFTDMLGGEIGVKSEVGKGSTFTVTIPSNL
jgi:PAS domain S-box-containing protein